MATKLDVMPLDSAAGRG